MRQSRLGYYADFAVYPVLIALMILMVADETTPAEWAIALAFAAAGAVLWTLMEYLLHRFLLHGNTRIAALHDQHHAWPRACIGTPTWLSVAALAFIALLPVSLGTRLIVTAGLAAGLMAGFLWYGLVHHTIHHGKPRLLAQAITGAARRHFKHHGAEGAGNFGVTTSFWDRLFGTSLAAPSGQRSEARARQSTLMGEEFRR